MEQAKPSDLGRQGRQRPYGTLFVGRWIQNAHGRHTRLLAWHTIGAELRHSCSASNLLCQHCDTLSGAVLVAEADGQRYIIPMTQTVLELQLDGLVGPTHHFGGLSFGNVASMTHAGWHSRPREAARQGLAKMRKVCALGVQ